MNKKHSVEGEIKWAALKLTASIAAGVALVTLVSTYAETLVW
ncbi:hypothetical protein QUF61_17535 [Candidatus Venteria ishoeyi]|nr:hypothetical protein [Candidatus Venteria ishoeyi]MDM8548297.1 hypothetical protein [Candidatus Venteria ishoeyi]